ncbi:Vacuolar membrane protease [Mortierella sp. AM989]|nr:Vacuolar membrane protease [Mortierella sp. AM989]
MDSSNLEEDSDNVSSSSSFNEGISSGHHQPYPWTSYSIHQMQELLRQRGQLTTGSRSTLRKRLRNCEQTPISATTTAKSTSLGESSTTVGVDTVVKGTSISSINRVTAGLLDGAEVALGIGTSVMEESSQCLAFGDGVDHQTLDELVTKKPRTESQSLRSRFPKRTNSFSAHFAGNEFARYIWSKGTGADSFRWAILEFINRRKEALETERHEISVYTSPLTVLSYFFLYILHEFRMALLWIISQQYLLVVLPIIAATIYFIYQTNGAHQPLLKHAESGLIWYGYWALLGIASSVGLGTGLHTFILFLGPHIAEVTLTAYKCGNTDFDVRGDSRFVCKSPETVMVPLRIYTIFQAVQWESFFWGFGTAIGELPPYFVARAAALSGNRNEELAAIEDLLKKKPDSVSYKERILLMVHEGMKRLGFFGIFLCASIPNPLFDLAGITCGHFLIPFSTFFGATFLGKAVVKSSIQTLFVILMFSADTLASFMSWLERSAPFIHGYLADGINSQKGALHGEGKVSEDDLENSTSLVGLIWNTIIFIMISYFLLSIVETMALAQIKRRHDQEIIELEGKIRSGDTKAFFVAVSEETAVSSKNREIQDPTVTTTITTSTTTTKTTPGDTDSC